MRARVIHFPEPAICSSSQKALPKNQVVFLFDNDAEGLDAHQRLSKQAANEHARNYAPRLNPSEHSRLKDRKAFGMPDINCRAAAIECYLDLNLRDHPPARIVWTNYKKELGAYQGAFGDDEVIDYTAYRFEEKVKGRCFTKIEILD